MNNRKIKKMLNECAFDVNKHRSLSILAKEADANYCLMRAREILQEELHNLKASNIDIHEKELIDEGLIQAVQLITLARAKIK